MPGQKSITYRRRGETGTLTLSGVVDIFEAVLLHTTAQRILEEAKANTVQLDWAEAERLDVSAMQIIFALRRDLEAAGRRFTLSVTPERIAHTMQQTGLPISS